MSTVANYDTSITFHGSTIPTILIAYNTGFFFRLPLKTNQLPPNPKTRQFLLSYLGGGIQLKKEYLFWTVEDVGQQVILIWGWHWFFVFTYLTFRWPKDWNLHWLFKRKKISEIQCLTFAHFHWFRFKKTNGLDFLLHPTPCLIETKYEQLFFCTEI